ncbi:MAG: glutamate--tRNA ligase [Acidobacteriota bacterium]
MAVRVRFAPSPTGHLHVGNARTALFNWLFAKQHHGQFILRIEDTDVSRSEGRFEQVIYDGLRWMGLLWDEGPDVPGPCGPYRQSERIGLYREKADTLVRDGKAYFCFCSEAELAEQAEKAKRAGEVWKYPGTCQRLSSSSVRERLDRGDSAVIRLKIGPGAVRFRDVVHGHMEFSNDVISDLILIRSNGLPTYNYAVVVDDALMGITHVIRGDDHLSNTPKQVLIYEAFGWELPEFAHLSTILGTDHSRLSKRHGATSIQNFQEMGILPEALVNYLALLGWAPGEGESEIIPTRDLISRFRLDRVSKSAAVFDTQKLQWLNRHYLKECRRERLIELVEPHLRQAGLIDVFDNQVREWVGQLLEILLPGLDQLDQIASKARAIWLFDVAGALESPEVQEVLAQDGAGDVIRQLHAQLSAVSGDVVPQWKNVVGAVKAATGQKGKNLFHPIRVALTGSTAGPELDRLLPLYEVGSRLPLGTPLKGPVARVGAFVSALDKD